MTQTKDELPMETWRERARDAFVEERLLLENTDRHLGDRKETSKGIQRAEGPERRRETETEEEKGGEELKRKGVDERGREGPEGGERARYGGPQTAQQPSAHRLPPLPLD